MATLLAGGYTDLEINKLTNGNGTTEPKGIVTSLSANTNVRVKITTGGSLGVGDIYAAWEALPVRFRQNRSTAWFSSRPTGERGLFAWSRVGATTDTDLAFRMITNVT
jgi:hypothetical protein